VCTGKIKHKGSTYLEQWNYLKGLLPPDRVKEAKLTLPAPEWYHLRYQAGHAYPKEVYANDAEYFADIAVAYQTELKILYDAGCRNVTIDDPNLACKIARECNSAGITNSNVVRFLFGEDVSWV
jgi:methionine synthase II (cobalamin-independent)